MLETILAAMGVHGIGYDVQRVQTEHRLRLIGLWQIPKGARVLEIGCGQGDTTAALACVVGEGGFVHGVDTAPGSYGAPSTLGEARERLLASALGGRIRMDFETDIMTGSFVPDGPYDVAVLSHSLWYFQDREAVLGVLKRLRGLAKRLCIAEWDIRVRLPEQTAHFYAANLQGLCACFLPQSGSNIRTLLTPEEIAELATRAGWAVRREEAIFSPELQDGVWEVSMAVFEYPGIIAGISGMPGKMKDLLRAQLRLLADMERKDMLPLDVYAMAADGGT